MFLTKREVIEIMLRPQPMPEDVQEELTASLMHNSPGELMIEFNKSTKLIILPAGGDLYAIKY